MDYSEVKIDELILNEDDIDWDLFSKTRRELSLAEIRLFRSKIKWNIFFLKGGMLTYEQLKVASKYFNDATYSVLSINHWWLSEKFIIENKTKFHWKKLIRTADLSPSVYTACLDAITDQIPNHSELVSEFENALHFDINSPEYEEVRLYLLVK